ncbi:2-hydroxychromene-2-carboxylate isomerase [Niveibacterium umoris]|uniref:2-hydroxychromene-2-carboxylate isomerase n=1 Tax=Niveibacterium umoris TaxID=1193620 RepID=A0A840BMT4_9RHOO|nr:2-hydroxychromene-2-carboxylate isomerase [Niveibacterium umoris]MBB4013953.1 2-hydroxychromene-2-carboxylate isomerase [Niveibacterium umoris]
MSAFIDFYFDFASPYCYVGSKLIEEIAERHGRTVIWHPMVLGAAFKAVGGAPLPTLPLRHDYVERDVTRLAKFYGLPYQHPKQYPIPTQHAAAAFLWGQDRDPERAKAFAAQVFQAYFVEGRNIAELDVVLDLIESFGLDRSAAHEALNGAPVKERLKAETELAIARGVFSAPFFIVDGEPFWGYSRLPILEKWLADGPF